MPGDTKVSESKLDSSSQGGQGWRFYSWSGGAWRGGGFTFGCCCWTVWIPAESASSPSPRTSPPGPGRGWGPFYPYPSGICRPPSPRPRMGRTWIGTRKRHLAQPHIGCHSMYLFPPAPSVQHLHVRPHPLRVDPINQEIELTHTWASELFQSLRMDPINLLRSPGIVCHTHGKGAESSL